MNSQLILVFAILSYLALHISASPNNKSKYPDAVIIRKRDKEKGVDLESYAGTVHPSEDLESWRIECFSAFFSTGCNVNSDCDLCTGFACYNISIRQEGGVAGYRFGCVEEPTWALSLKCESTLNIDNDKEEVCYCNANYCNSASTLLANLLVFIYSLSSSATLFLVIP